MIQSPDDWATTRLQIEKAERRARAEGIDLKSLAASSRDAAPRELASGAALAERGRMLAETVGDRAKDTFERLIDGDELQPISYLPRGVVAARPVCRLTLNDLAHRRQGYATGFLIAPGVLLTNNHVFPAEAAARNSIAEFDVERDVLENPKPSQSFALNPDRLFKTSLTLDFSVVAVAETSAGGVPLADYGYLPLIATPGKAVEGEWLTIIQHPGGQEKQVCIRENKLLKRAEDVLWYSTDTLGGSSGSPVYNNSWQVVALHHKGVPETKNGVYQTTDGRDFDPARDSEQAIKWLANEGIRISRVIAELRALAPDEPLLEPVFAMTPERAQALTDRLAAGRAAAPPVVVNIPAQPPSTSTSEAARTAPAMTARSITVTLDIAADGRVSVRPGADGFRESLDLDEARRRAPSEEPGTEFDVPFEDDYSPGGPRKGYKADFLGAGFEVPLPDLAGLKDAAVEVDQPGPNGKYVLDYLGYSLVMHAERKFAIYTAANLDGGHRFNLNRPHDVWRYDPRIPRSAQIGDYYYARNQFDRGHLTRREDMEYGKKPTAAIQQAADTLHFTNCTPQHARFNQNKELWQGLERHILEESLEASVFAAQVFTGPVLDEGDPVWEKYKDVQYPLKFWKIAVARTSADKLFAAGFVLDQSDVIAQYGIEATVEVPFGAFKTYQVPVEEIERLTGLKFVSGKDGRKSLSDADPLRTGSPSRARRRRTSLEESTAAGPALPSSYVPLENRLDIVRG